MAEEPLDRETHEGYLSTIATTLQEVLTEIKRLRKDVQEVTTEVSSPER